MRRTHWQWLSSWVVFAYFEASFLSLAFAQKPEATTKDLGTAPKPTVVAHPSPSPASVTSTSAEPSSGSLVPSPTPSLAVSTITSTSSKPLSNVSFEKRTLSTGLGDINITVHVPSDWPELDAASLPTIEPINDVVTLVRRGYGAHGPNTKPSVMREVVVVCSKANATHWADTIRDAAFVQMIAAVEKEVRKYTSIASIEPEPIRTSGLLFEQNFEAKGNLIVDGLRSTGKNSKAYGVTIQGLNILGFYSPNQDQTELLVCGVTCAHMPEMGEPSLCPDIIKSIQISGALAAAPKRSRVAELVFAWRQDRTMMLLSLVGAIVGICLAGLGIWALVRHRKPHRESLLPYSEEHHEHEPRSEQAEHVPAYKPVEPLSFDMHASPPPAKGYFEPETLLRKSNKE